MSDGPDPDEIWHRALDTPGDAVLPGDKALAAVLLAHGAIMNGGVLNFVEEYSSAEVFAAETGYRWLGIDAVAELILEVREECARLGGPEDPEKLEVKADDAYAEVIDDDTELEAFFLSRLTERPDDFAPLD